MIAKIVQTAKQTVNAIVDIQSARRCASDFTRPVVSSLRIKCSRAALERHRDRAKQKSCRPSRRARRHDDLIGSFAFAPTVGRYRFL
jgi:hypothetical protein